MLTVHWVPGTGLGMLYMLELIFIKPYEMDSYFYFSVKKFELNKLHTVLNNLVVVQKWTAIKEEN